MLAAFRVTPLALPTSLYAYAPVWRFQDRHGDWVLKQTGRAFSTAPATAEWTSGLSRAGVPTVAPARLFAPNPRPLQTLGEERWWVVYPFVAGSPYLGTRAQIQAAGDLLGQIHSASPGWASSLTTITGLPIPLAERHTTVLAEVLAHLRQDVPAQAEAIAARLAASSTPTAHGDLPMVGGSFDFKAANLVYARNHRPVLIDPDHAARLPRLLDLATALILFHNDTPSAPARLWTPAEWRLFCTTYRRHVSLDQREVAAWPTLLCEVWAQQTLWLLGNWPEGWADRRERTYLLDLARLDPQAYPL